MVNNALNSLPFAEVLLRDGLLTKPQLEEALGRESGKSSGQWVQYVVFKRWISEEEMAVRLAQFWNIPRCDLAELHIPRGVVRTIPEYFEKKHAVIPIKRSGRDMTIGMFNPGDVEVIKEIQGMTGFRCVPVVVVLSKLEKALQNVYGTCCFDPGLMHSLAHIGLDPDAPPPEPPSIPTELLKEIEIVAGRYAGKTPLDLRVALTKNCVFLHDGDIPLFRLMYCGPGNRWRFGLYTWPAREYQDEAIPSFTFTCSLEEGMKQGVEAFY